MGFNRASAQEIGSNTGTLSSFPTIGSSSSGTNAASATPPQAPPAPPPIPPPLAPTSSLFAPTIPYGGSVSQTGETLAESLQQQQGNQPYNLRVGPVQIRAEADLTADVNDNIGLNKDGREADLIFVPMGVLHGRWEISDLNALTFNIGVGYQAYLLHSQYDCVLIAPDSEVNFNIFVGDCAINFHDSFSYEQDPTEVGQLSNQVRLSRFQNDVGVSARWDLDTFMVEADYDHTNLWVMDSIYNYLTNQTDTFAPRITWKLNETLSTGISATVSDTRYEQSFENDNTSESIGPFVSVTFSNFLSLTASAGGFLTQYDQGGGNGDNSDLSSYYANLGVTHRITQYLTESLTAGKEYLPGLTSNYTQRIYVTYGDSWSATKEISVGASLFWENLQDSDASFREDSNRYGVGLSLSDTLTDHLNVNLGYQFLLKDADPSILSYYQNEGTLGMVYNF
ncbi:MAG TPA: hypothetical protein VHY09_02075 [Candidatus Methylacidiphilales bacterium]|jgi:hypothetical protein|nr:hypothetical protein [Candidatus Methylacidiphilales bacterium]